MKNGWWLALGVVFGLLGAGGIWLASAPPRGNPIELLPPPTQIPIQVYVTGEVESPGVYALPPDSRVQDAIETAGGLTEDANSQALNLAAALQDGAQVWVPGMASETNLPESAQAPEVQVSIDEQPASIKPGVLININTATQAELETISGIGPVTAEKIITYREDNGLFTGIEDIQKVSGIGPATFDKIKDFITVSEP